MVVRVPKKQQQEFPSLGADHSPKHGNVRRERNKNPNKARAAKGKGKFKMGGNIDANPESNGNQLNMKNSGAVLSGSGKLMRGVEGGGHILNVNCMGYGGTDSDKTSPNLIAVDGDSNNLPSVVGEGISAEKREKSGNSGGGGGRNDVGRDNGSNIMAHSGTSSSISSFTFSHSGSSFSSSSSSGGDGGESEGTHNGGGSNDGGKIANRGNGNEDDSCIRFDGSNSPFRITGTCTLLLDCSSAA